jgi:hypothetical protein
MRVRMGGFIGVWPCIVWLCGIIYCYGCFRQFFARLLVYYYVCIDTYRKSVLCSSFGPFWSNRFFPWCRLFSHYSVNFFKYSWRTLSLSCCILYSVGVPYIWCLGSVRFGLCKTCDNLHKLVYIYPCDSICWLWLFFKYIANCAFGFVGYLSIMFFNKFVIVGTLLPVFVKATHFCLSFVLLSCFSLCFIWIRKFISCFCRIRCFRQCLW